MSTLLRPSRLRLNAGFVAADASCESAVGCRGDSFSTLNCLLAPGLILQRVDVPFERHSVVEHSFRYIAPTIWTRGANYKMLRKHDADKPGVLSQRELWGGVIAELSPCTVALREQGDAGGAAAQPTQARRVIAEGPPPKHDPQPAQQYLQPSRACHRAPLLPTIFASVCPSFLLHFRIPRHQRTSLPPSLRCGQWSTRTSCSDSWRR